MRRWSSPEHFEVAEFEIQAASPVKVPALAGVELGWDQLVAKLARTLSDDGGLVH